MRLYKNANITHKYFQIMKIHTKNRQKSKIRNQKCLLMVLKIVLKTPCQKCLL